MLKLNLLKNKYNTYIPTITMLTLSLILFLTVGLFSLLSWQNKRLELAKALSQLTLLNARKSTLDSLSPQVTTLAADKLLLDSVLPTDPSIPIVMDQVQQIAVESGVSLTSLQFASKNETASAIFMQAAATGPYSSIVNFIKNLENSGRFLAVNSLRFSTVSTPGVEGVNVTLDLSSPYFKPSLSGVLDAGQLTGAEFLNLMTRLRSFRIYTPRGGDSSTGKANPFSQ